MRHVLIGHVGDNGGSLDVLADMHDLLRATVGSAASGAAIAAPDAALPEQERIPVLTDVEDAFRIAYGAAPGMAWLIRPDGHVGWRGTTPAALTSYLARIDCSGIEGAEAPDDRPTRLTASTAVPADSSRAGTPD